MESQPDGHLYAPLSASPVPADRNDWIGNWTIERGSLCGALNISGFSDLQITRRVTYVRASFTAADGTFEPVDAALDPADPRHMTIAIGFPGVRSPFELYCFRTDDADAESAVLWCATEAADG